VIGFCERFCFVPKGRGARERLRLRPWQQLIVRGLYNEPRPRSGLLSLPRGNGKTTLAAFLATYELFGAGVESAQVLAVASDERQARILASTVRRMIELEPGLESRSSVFFDRISVPGSNSELRALPSEHAALQGWDPSFAVLDELHVVNEDVWEALELASGKRDRSLLLAISTPATTEDSVMWKLVEQGRDGDNPSFYFKEWAAPDGCDLADEAAWHEANPALSDFLAIDALRSTMRTVREESFRRYRLGQWVQDETAWLPLGVWASCARAGGIADGAKVVLGFDGSVNNDATGIVAVSIAELPYLVPVGLWENQEIPILAVEDTIRALCQRFEVVAIVADSWRWERSLQILAAEGLPVEKFAQQPTRMTPATQKFYAAAMTGGLAHDGNPDLARHIANARVRTDARGTRISKEKKWSTARIDLAVAAIMAFDVATSYEAPKEMIPMFGVTY
jgi:phage terminase large subunit-like protein